MEKSNDYKGAEGGETSASQKMGEAYDLIYNQLSHFVDMPTEYRKVVTLWIVGTYFHNYCVSYPYLYFNAMRGSGKSRILEFIANTAYGGKGKKQSGITEAVLFRSPEGATLVLDEMESISGKDKAVLREYLNAAYKRGATVERTRKVKKNGGEDYEVQTFKIFRPIVIANIYGMEDVLADRCLTLILEKSNSPLYTKMMEDFGGNPDLAAARGLLIRAKGDEMAVSSRVLGSIQDWNSYIYTKYHTLSTSSYIFPSSPLDTSKPEEVERFECYNIIDSLNISGRNLELILPLLMIARSLSREMFDEMIPILSAIVKEKKDEEFAEDRDVSVIHFVSEQDQLRYQYMPVSQLAGLFKTFMSGTEDFDDRWLNAKWMGLSLKRLKLIADKKATKTSKMILLAVDKAKEKIKMFKTEDKTNERQTT